MTARVVTDPAELIELYSRDPQRHIYALVDLQEPYWSASTWWRDGDAAVGLVGLPTGEQVLYAVSSADQAGTLALVASIQQQIPPCLVTGVTGIAATFEAAGRTLAWHRGYHRYHLVDRRRVPKPPGTVEPLGSDDADAVLALCATDPKAVFFLPYMLDDHSFVGVRAKTPNADDDQLVAMAGTHLMSEPLGVAAIGAVLTHPDHRGRGLGAAVTAGVIERLEGRVSTIGLNCTDANVAAIAIYRRLGFEPVLAYEECEMLR